MTKLRCCHRSHRDLWDDFATLFRQAGRVLWLLVHLFSFTADGAEEEHQGRTDRKVMIRDRIVAQGPPPGLLGYVGMVRRWRGCRSDRASDVPQWNTPRPSLARRLDDAPADGSVNVWAISCFFSRSPRFAGNGLSHTPWSRRVSAMPGPNGARIIEACPMDRAKTGEIGRAVCRVDLGSSRKGGFPGGCASQADGRPLMRLESLINGLRGLRLSKWAAKSRCAACRPVIDAR